MVDENATFSEIVELKNEWRVDDELASTADLKVVSTEGTHEEES